MVWNFLIKFFWTYNFLTHNFFYPKMTPKFVWTQLFFWPTICIRLKSFLGPNFFWTKYCLDQQGFYLEFIRTQNFVLTTDIRLLDSNINKTKRKIIILMGFGQNQNYNSLVYRQLKSYGIDLIPFRGGRNQKLCLKYKVFPSWTLLT